jgi:hypothetical protein
VADQKKPENLKLPISTTVEVDGLKLKLLKAAYEKEGIGGAQKEAAFANLKAFKNEVYARIDGELLAYGNIAKRQVDAAFGV